jgi:hypothetical protein
MPAQRWRLSTTLRGLRRLRWRRGKQSRTSRFQALGRLAGHPSGDKKGDEHGPASTGQSSRDIARSHHLQYKSARAPAALRRLTASVAASNHVRSTTVVGAAPSSCLLRHALSPVTERTAWTRSIPRSPLEDRSTSNSGSSTIPPSDAAIPSSGQTVAAAHQTMLPGSTLGLQRH